MVESVMPTRLSSMSAMIRGMNGVAQACAGLTVGRLHAEHRRQQHRAREYFPERRGRGVQRIAAAGGEAEQDELRIRLAA